MLRLCWLGIRSADYDATVRLWRDVLGLRIEFEQATTAELSLPTGDRVQVFGPGRSVLRLSSSRTQPGRWRSSKWRDVSSARSELEAAGIELVGELDHDAEWEWLHFRGPDGNLYEPASRRAAS